MMEKFYTVEEFAELLRVKRRKIQKMIKEKRLHPINLGTANKPRYAIPDDDLLRLRAESFQDDNHQA